MQGRPSSRHLLLQRLDQILFEQGVKHEPRRFGDFGQRMIELLLRAHHRVKMLDRRHIGVLRRGRARDRDQGFAGRVGHQMEMEIAGVGHLYEDRRDMWISWEEATAWR